MRDPTGKSADRFHLLRLPKLFLQVPLRSNILRGADDADDFSTRAANRKGTVVDPSHHAVGALNSICFVVITARLLGGREWQDARAIVRMNCGGPVVWSCGDTGAGAPPDSFVTRAHIDEFIARRVFHPEHFLNVLGQLTESLLALAQGLLCAAPRLVQLVGLQRKSDVDCQFIEQSEFFRAEKI